MQLDQPDAVFKDLNIHCSVFGIPSICVYAHVLSVIIFVMISANVCESILLFFDKNDLWLSINVFFMFA